MTSSQTGGRGRNAAIGDAFAEIAALLRLGRRERFRVRAYDDAARLLRRLPVDASTLPPDRLARLRGVGPTIARMVAEHLEHGTIGYLDDLRADHPPGIGALLQVQGVSPRSARALSASGVRGLRDLAAMPVAELAAVEGVGERTAGVITRGLERTALRRDDPLVLRTARRQAAALAAWVAALPRIDRALVAGDVRRGIEAPARLDVVAVAEEPASAVTAMDANIDGATSPLAPVALLAAGATSREVLTVDGRIAAVSVVGAGEEGVALLRATGDAAHVAAVLDARETSSIGNRSTGVDRQGHRGMVAVASDDSAPARLAAERGVYAAAGLPWIPPALRDGLDAVEAVLAGRPLPELVRLAHLRGDLHVHTDWSGDGKDSPEAMAQAALARGYAYVAFTDHAEDLSINGLARAQVTARREQLAELRDRVPAIALLDAAELNIGADGGLDYDAEFLLAYDVTVASVHSLLHAPRAQQTARILEAIASPAVTVIGHPVGRLIGIRPGAAIDLAAIAEAAAETGTALEVNGSPRRLDLDSAMVRAAITAGAVVACSSDAHAVAELGYVEEAVAVARRGWATAAQVLNARDLDDLLRFAAAKRSQA